MKNLQKNMKNGNQQLNKQRMHNGNGKEKPKTHCNTRRIIRRVFERGIKSE